MISPKIFTKHKCDTESLKALFTSKKPSEKVEKLVELIRDRIKDGRNRSLQNYKVWAAVDIAYDAPFYQETPTLIRHIANTCTTADQVKTACQKWGLSLDSLFCKSTDAKGAEILELNMPKFFQVLVPVVRAYFAVRLSKIFNDRNLDPLFEYEPRHYTQRNRVLCEIITDIVDTMSVQFGYASNLKQAIFNALLYSVAIEFPCEAWYVEKQEDENGTEYVVKEGVRYVIPHITRTFYDLQYPVQTFNTNTGCSFAGYWSILRYGDVAKNPVYWNTDKITYGQTNWLDPKGTYGNYFEQVYPCTLQLPALKEKSNETNRESDVQYYTRTDYDKAVFVTHIFMRLTPADWGLGDYKFPVWFRFIIGADDAILFAEPFPYSPCNVAYYDPDQNRSKNASLGLELIPWQDLLGNTLTQLVLTMKRNLANIIFYDTSLDVGDQIKEIQRRSNWQYENINFIGIDQLKAFRSGVAPEKAIQEVKFAYNETSSMVGSINMQLMLMERMLGISAQEIGSPASHQQGNKEIEMIATSAGNRVTYTASGIDDYVDAKKRQLHEANLAYRDDKVVAEVSSDIEDLEKHLAELGFKTDTKSKDGIVVSGSKSKLKDMSIENIATQRDGPDRYKDTAVAQAMYTALTAIGQNPALLQMLDPVSLKDLYEVAARYSGADRDFTLKLNKDGVMSNQLSQLIQQLTDTISKKVEQDIAQSVAKPAAEALHEQEQINSQQTEQLMQLTQQLSVLKNQLDQITALASQAPQLPPQPNEPIPQPAIAAEGGVPVQMAQPIGV